MILAAGAGKRMQPLTDHIPKPLLEVAGKPLIQHQIEHLVSAGIRDIMINHGRLGEMIEARLGDGRQFSARLYYSAEGDTPLETAGGIIRVLPFFDGRPFVVVNADIYTKYDFSSLQLPPGSLAHLVLVDNPGHHKQGDFSLDGYVLGTEGDKKLTYSGIGVYQPVFFDGYNQGPRPLAPLIRKAAAAGRVTGEYYAGLWFDVGTPERLQEINDLCK